MLPLRLVLDTNIIISAALKANGPQRTVLLLALTKPARLYASNAILAEYQHPPTGGDTFNFCAGIQDYLPIGIFAVMDVSDFYRILIRKVKRRGGSCRIANEIQPAELSAS